MLTRRQSLLTLLLPLPAWSLEPAASTATGTPVLRIGIDNNNDSGLSHASRAVLEVAYARLGQSVRFEPFPLRRSLKLCSAGIIDADTARAAETIAENPSLLRVSQAINWLEVRAVMDKPGTTSPRDWAGLRGLRVAYPRGVGPIERRIAAVPRRSEAANGRDALRMLRSGMVDVALVLLPPDLRPSQPALLQGLTLLPQSFGSSALYHVLHERHLALLPRLNEQLQQMERSGEATRLRRQALQELAAALEAEAAASR